jgi:predicted cobalt transporter CbtA
MATAVALWLLFRSRGLALPALGVLLLLAPHVVGAPHPAEIEASRVPAELAARFASLSLAVHAVLWALTGAFVGWVWQRNERLATAEG